MGKIISISIAAYNVEKFLRDTLDSLVHPAIVDDIEVLVIDDGSKDCTAQIGREYQEKYPGSFYLISKPNGGYGSTINAAMDAATGKYFKTLDGDDWFDTEQFVDLVQALKRTDADLVVTPFTMVHEGTNVKEIVQCKQEFGEKIVDFEQLPMQVYKGIRMHSIAYKTSLLQKNSIRIGEHCFYTDVEYIAFPMVHVNSVVFLQHNVYQYRIGLEGQSMSVTGFQKHYRDHLKVTHRMEQFYRACGEKGLSPAKNAYLSCVLKDLVTMQYAIFLLVGTKREFMDFDSNLKEKNPELYAAAAGKKILLLRKTNFALLGPLRLYSRLRA